MTILTLENCWRILIGLCVFMLPTAAVATPLTPAIEKCNLLGKQTGWKGIAWTFVGFVLACFVFVLGGVVGYKAWTYQPFQDFLAILIRDILSL